MKRSLISCAIIASLLLSACNNDNKEVSAENQTATAAASSSMASAPAHSNSQNNQVTQNITELYKEATKILFKHRALSATAYGLSAEEVGVEYAQTLDNFSPASEAKLRAELVAITQKISDFSLSKDNLDESDNQQVMSSITRYYSGHPEFTVGYIDVWMGLSPFIVNQINGPLIDIPSSMQNDQPITTEQEALDYIARLAKFDQLVASITEKLAFDSKQNWIPPQSTVSGAVRYLEGFTKVAANEHVLVSNFVNKVNKIESISTEKKQQLIAQVTDTVSTVVYPAYQAIAKTTTALLSHARSEDGIWAQPNGEVYYQEAIRQLGDSDLSADDIHQLGLAEVTRITAEMDAILRSEGYKNGTVGERMALINEEPRFLYADSDKGRAELLADLNRYIADINAKMTPYFKTAPSYQVEVRSFPVEIQDGAAGGQYSPPSLDGSKPGIYWINLRDMKANPKFGLKTLTYHEANPGHHWQVALNMDQASLPFLRRIAPYNAYVEGWALYSEKVAQELGMYENDPFGDLGRLQAEIFRAVRLVVDTGMHHKRWTREQAIAYMSEKTGTAESDVVAEIERYISWPGQALGYKLGMLKILSLRDYAQTQLGDKFDLSDFHDVVLLGGAVPMTVLERSVKQWVASQL